MDTTKSLLAGDISLALAMAHLRFQDAAISSHANRPKPTRPNSARTP